ncbi:hypothetical protein [Verrucomicrobium spinosum]|uniref:hypothetical protein n=2 Tax=Verrucomicrobium spinosum TaxID=2736 RepID=UPI0001744A1E|nr:hypothetical protein [Verrucomicrobium spinosum]
MKMELTDVQKPHRQYVIRTALFMSGYVLVNLAAIAGAFDDARGKGAWALGLVVSAPIIGQLWSLLAYMRDADEYVRSVMARTFIIASGLAMALFCTWGFLETYAGARHAPAWLIVPTFYAAFGLVTLFTRDSRPSQP